MQTREVSRSSRGTIVQCTAFSRGRLMFRGRGSGFGLQVNRTRPCGLVAPVDPERERALHLSTTFLGLVCLSQENRTKSLPWQCEREEQWLLIRSPRCRMVGIRVARGYHTNHKTRGRRTADVSTHRLCRPPPRATSARAVMFSILRQTVRCGTTQAPAAGGGGGVVHAHTRTCTRTPRGGRQAVTGGAPRAHRVRLADHVTRKHPH